jgi:thioredoxin-like negative regulator of GroEL
MKQILYFTASWCQPCRALGPIMESLNGQISYNKLDVDSNPDLAVKYKVRSVPTLVLVENGIEKNRLTGVHQSPEILRFYNS